MATLGIWLGVRVRIFTNKQPIEYSCSSLSRAVASSKRRIVSARVNQRTVEALMGSPSLEVTRRGVEFQTLQIGTFNTWSKSNSQVSWRGGVPQ